MDAIRELFTVNFSYIFLSVVVILAGVKSVAALLEWTVEKLGLETKWMREKREEHELLLQTAQALASLQKTHDALILANKEVLGNIINERYQKYLLLGAIPADEVDEFTNIHDAYRALNGNHGGDLKYEYVTEQLPVIPVETTMVTKDEETKS